MISGYTNDDDVTQVFYLVDEDVEPFKHGGRINIYRSHERIIRKRRTVPFKDANFSNESRIFKVAISGRCLISHREQDCAP